MRILLVEDNHRVIHALKMSLIEEGYAIDTAFDGPEGQALAEVAGRCRDDVPVRHGASDVEPGAELEAARVLKGFAGNGKVNSQTICKSRRFNKSGFSDRFKQRFR